MSAARTAGGAGGAGPRLSVIVVTHDSAGEIRRSLPAIAAQLGEGDELIVVDNASTDGSAELACELVPEARVIERRENRGFGAGANAGAATAHGELLLFLNPDAEVRPGFTEAIRRPLVEQPGWGAWQALVTCEGGRRVNTWGGVLHFTGIAWAGGMGEPVAEAPSGPREVGFASGACLAVRREVWDLVGGFAPGFFLYHEDVELSLRLRRAGYGVGIEPRAVCDHDYEFVKGPHKWRYLERNRWSTILRTYPVGLLAVTLPALLATELALLLVAAAGGWLPEKLHAAGETARSLPSLLRERRAIRIATLGRGGESADSAALAADLSAGLDSPYLGRVGRSRLLGALLGAYWSVARALLGAGGSRPEA